MKLNNLLGTTEQENLKIDLCFYNFWNYEALYISDEEKWLDLEKRTENSILLTSYLYLNMKGSVKSKDLYNTYKNTAGFDFFNAEDGLKRKLTNEMMDEVCSFYGLADNCKMSEVLDIYNNLIQKGT